MAAYVETLPDSGTRSSSRRQSTQSSYSYTQEQQVTGPAPPEAYIPRAGSDILEETPPFPEPLLPLNSSQPAIDPLSQQVVIPKLRRTSRHTSLSSKDVLPASHLSDAPVDRRASSTRRRAGTINLEEVLSLFVKSRSEAKDARQHLKATLEKLEDARRRADKAERLAGELAARVGEVAGDRTTALRDASKAREELGMYKMQYSRAQHELERGNQLLQDSEARRNEAEEEAARARETARNIRTMLLVERAKEEGRLEGFNQGMRARERVDYDGYGDYSDGLDERDRQRAREAINDIVSVVDERHDNKSVQRPFPSPAVQQTPEQPPPRPPPPAEPQFPSGASPTSQPSIIIPLSQESFFTPTPARRAPETRRPNSISTDTTTTLPAAPSNFAPPTSGAPKMPTIPETISRRTSVQSSVPHVINTEPEPARRESVRRSQPPSAGGTPRAQSGELPQPVTYAVPPPGTVDRTPNSFVVPPPASSTGRPPSRSSIRGVGSPSMTTAELQRLVAQQSQQGFFDDRRSLASDLRGPPAAPPVPRQAPRSGPPPRWVPDRLTMPPQLAPTGPPSPSNFRPPLPTAPPPHAIPPHMVPATTNPPDFRPSSRASSRGHTRTQSMSSPSRPPPDMPHNAAPVRPSPRPLHRRSTSTGAPDIDISVQSPSDPDFSYTRQHGDTPDVRAPPGRDYLSPHSAPFSLPSVAAPVAPPSVPSPTSTNRDTPRSFSNPLPQQYLPRVHAEQSPQDTRPPQPFHPHNFAPPRDTRNSQTFVPRVAVSQSSRDSQPQYFMPSRTYGDVPSRPRSSQGMAPGHASAIPSHIYAAPPTRPRSSQGMAPQRTPPAFVPSLAPSSSSGIPSPQASPRVGGRTPIYAGQQPVPIPPRNGSPAPLMVPSPQARTARLSNAGATPRAMNGHLPPRSPTGSVSNLPAPRSPTGSVSNLPARAPSPLRGEQGSLFTRWDSHSVEDMGDMAALAMATSSTTRPAPAEATVGRKGGSRRR